MTKTRNSTRRLKVGVLISTLLFAACSSTKFIVKTDPEGAKVFFENSDNRERRLLGATPLELRYKDVNAGSSPFFAVVIIKEGFEERRVLIPDVMPFRSGSDLRLELSMKKNPYDGPQPIDNAVWNDAIELLFDAQKLALSKNYEPALTKVNTAIKKTGGFHKAYTLMGSIYFLMKDYRKSLKSWETASKLNSRDQEAVRMIQLLKSRIQMSRE